MVHKEEAVVVVKKLLFLIFILIPVILYSQEEIKNELQVNFNTYFDNYHVTVFYPSINISKSIDANTSINGSYTIDAITSASMKMVFKVDGITSATPSKQGGQNSTPDELRHQVNFGFTRNISSVSFSANGMYSIEHDYSSKTFAANLSVPFAKKNTVVQLGFTKNWDKIFPKTRFWTKDRNTSMLNLGLTQILSKSIITQLDFSFTNIDGYMLDGYQVVRIVNGPNFSILEPIEPDKRIRRAAGIRTNFGISKTSTILIGYRYYWDTWDINSHTFEGAFKTHLSDNFSLTLELRQYFQTKAFFFKPEYLIPETFMGVDSKLNSGYTTDFSIGINLKGDKSFNFPLLNSDKVTFMANLGVYHRHTDSPDWVIRLQDLYAILINLGFKFSI
jgi:hypothetical protein